MYGDLLIFIYIGVVLCAAIGLTIWLFLKAKRIAHDRKISMKIPVLVSLVVILVAAVSWILNFGWFRVFLTIWMIPLIHAVIFFITNLFAVCYTDKSKTLKLLNRLFILTYILAYVFFPDGGDIGEAYFFFGLIHNDKLSYIAYAVSHIIFLAHIVLLILQIIQMVKIRKADRKVPEK